MSFREDVDEEIRLCSKVYPGFEELGDAVGSLFVAADEFIKVSVGEDELDSDDVSQQEADALFRRGESLHPRVEVDREVFEGLTSVVCQGVVEMYPEIESAVEQFETGFIEAALPGCTDTFTFDDEAIAALLDLSSDDQDTGRDIPTLIVSLTLSMLYRGHTDDILENVDFNLWDEGNCPVCGQSPHYGLLSSDDAARFLDCWLCATRWSFPRLECPYCHNKDHEELGYFTVESIDFCRVYFCRECDKYFKVFDMEDYERKDANLVIHNMASLSCDLVAVSEGFRIGSDLQWIEEEGNH